MSFQLDLLMPPMLQAFDAACLPKNIFSRISLRRNPAAVERNGWANESGVEVRLARSLGSQSIGYGPVLAAATE